MKRSSFKPKPWHALFVLLAALTFAVSAFAPSAALAETDTVDMYRLYNPFTGEHLYTSDAEEIGTCVTNGWRYEGDAWTAPAKSNTPVYRLYNKYAGDHHYTTSKEERDTCVKAGWTDEGIGWYSDDAKAAPIYRGFNPNEKVGTHHYTASSSELQTMVKNGWRDEKIGWYAVGVPTETYTVQNSDKTAKSAGLTVTSASEVVYRLYDKSDNSHFYTTSAKEIGLYLMGNWAYEGPAWLAPKKGSGTPVYRMYNKWTNQYMYVSGTDERDNMVKNGWENQGHVFDSDNSKTCPIYRLYNQYTGGHHYTANGAEKDSLVKVGWTFETSEAIYALAVPTEDANSNAGASSYAGMVTSVDVKKVAKGYSTIYVHFRDGSTRSYTCWCGANTFTGTFKVEHTAYALDKNPTTVGSYTGDPQIINGWWVCYVADWKSTPDDPNRSRKGCDQGTHSNEYDEGQGFHYGEPGGSKGCILIPSKSDAAEFYDLMKQNVGTTVKIY